MLPPSLGVFGRRRACAALALLAWGLSLFALGMSHPLPWAGPFLGTLIAFWSNHRRVSRPPMFSLAPIAAVDALWGGLLATGMASALLWLGDSSFLAWLALAVFALCWKMEWCFPAMGMDACSRWARLHAQRAWAQHPHLLDALVANPHYDTVWGRPLVSFEAIVCDAPHARTQAGNSQVEGIEGRMYQRFARPFALPVVFAQDVLDSIEAARVGGRYHRGGTHGDGERQVFWQGPRTAHEKLAFAATISSLRGKTTPKGTP